MSLFSRDLMLIGLGVHGDAPPQASGQPQLKDGIHLRWSFRHERGFPWHGYYLLRRPHIPGALRSLFEVKLSYVEELLGDTELRAARFPDHGWEDQPVPSREPRAHLAARTGSPFRELLHVVNPADFNTSPAQFPLESQRRRRQAVGLDRGKGLTLSAPPGEPYRHVQLVLAFRDRVRSLTIRAHFGDKTVAETKVSGAPGGLRVVDVRAWAIDRVTIGRADALLADVKAVAALHRLREGSWQALAGPIALPVRHPAYPARSGTTDETGDRREAQQRVHYGSGTAFTDALPGSVMEDRGFVTIGSGSARARGSNTNWTTDLAGGVLHLPGGQARTVLRVDAADRLVLTRPYGGPALSQSAYVIRRDPFGQLYDGLTRLVEGGAAAGEMAHRRLLPTLDSGVLSATTGSPDMTGRSTAWTDRLVGHALQIRLHSGRARFIADSPYVFHDGQPWSNAVRGGVLEVEGQARGYRIHGLIAGHWAILDRPFKTAESDREETTAAALPGSHWGPGIERDYAIYEPHVYRIVEVRAASVLALDRPYAGQSGTDKEYRIDSRVVPPRTANRQARRQLHVANLRPLALTLLAAYDPAIAQMLGLYWLDRQDLFDPTSGDPNTYDYLLLADHEGRFGGDAANALAWITSPASEVEFWQWAVGHVLGKRPSLDGALLTGLEAATSPRPDAPAGVKGYVLPDEARINSALQPSMPVRSVLAGLRWRPSTQPAERQPVLFRVWRAFLGSQSGGGPPSDDAFSPLPGDQESVRFPGEARPVLGPGPESSAVDVEQLPPGWPPFTLQAFDRPFQTGWYSYRLSGIDLFGRHSELSDPASWHAFEDGAGDVRRHEFALNLHDDVAPPSPTGVEATLLDPLDPHLVRDAAYDRWRTALPDAVRDVRIGLRVRWRWPLSHQRQAPDTSSFLLFAHHDRPNVLTGRVIGVTSPGGVDSEVETDIAPPRRAARLVGTQLRVGRDSYQVSGASGGATLRLRVRNIGPTRSVAPLPGGACSVVIPEGHTLHHDFRISDLGQTPWDAPDFVQVGADEHVSEQFEVRRTRAGESLAGTEAFVSSEGMSLQDAASLAGVQPLADYLHLEDDAGAGVYPITGVDPSLKTVEILGQPQLPQGGSRWAIGQPVRVYELFLPTPDQPNAGGIDLSPSDDEPVVYGRVGVVAVDSRDNRSQVSPPSTVYRVKRTPPPTPAPPVAVEDSANVYASAADYHADAYYALRWKSRDGVRTFVYRALDRSVFRADWAERPRGPLPPEAFPDTAHWDQARRDQVGQELDALEGLATAGASEAEATAAYESLSNDALQILAGLPGTETAFTRRTVNALTSDDATLRNRPTASDPTGFELWPPGQPDPDRPLADPDLLVYLDRLDGRSRSRYFYRTRFVDNAHNTSPLSLATPPIYLRGDARPAAPRIIRAVASDGFIRLEWEPSPDPEVEAVRIYRSEGPDQARDLRLMRRIQELGTISAGPEATTRLRSWIDDGLEAGRVYSYRLVAVRVDGTASAPTEPHSVTAIDRRPPGPPRIARSEWVALRSSDGAEEPFPADGQLPAGHEGAVAVSWESLCPGERHVLSRRARGDLAWRPVARESDYETLADGRFRFYDRDTSPELAYEYRLGSISAQGIAGTDHAHFFLDTPIS